MQINECSYCGMLAITEDGICYNCQKALGQTENGQNPENKFENSPAPTITDTFSESFENENYEDDFQTEFNHEPTPPPRAGQTWGKCPVCNISISRNGETCQKCVVQNTYNVKSESGKRSPWGKIGAVFVLLMVTAGVGFYYFYYVDSAYEVNRKFEKATGLTNNIILDSVEVTGTAQMGVWAGRGWEMGGGQDMAFQMNFQKPGKSLMDFRQVIFENGSSIEKSVLKQGFDGTTGWKLTQLPNKPARLENADNGFGEDFLTGSEDSFSYLVLDEEGMKTKANVIKFFEENIRSFKVNEVEKQSPAKSYILITKKLAAESKTSLLVFDKNSGFLLGASQGEFMNGSPIDIFVSFEEYQRFLVQENGFFGKSRKSVLIPTVLKYKMGRNEQPSRSYNGMPDEMPTIVMSLKIKNFTTDKVISDELFKKPVLPTAPTANRNF